MLGRGARASGAIRFRSRPGQPLSELHPLSKSGAIMQTIQIVQNTYRAQLCTRLKGGLTVLPRQAVGGIALLAGGEWPRPQVQARRKLGRENCRMLRL